MLALLRRDRGIVAAALAVIAALGWVYLWGSPMPMPGASGVWVPGYLAFSFAMWFVMMIAMMTPSVAPVVLLYDRVMQRDAQGLHRRALAFFAGYLVAWAAFSAAATMAQAVLISMDLIDTMGVAGSRYFAAALLLTVAAYQWSPAKAACLERCHSPLSFIVRQRRGAFRSLRAGLAHGAWCVACCWALMAVLFAGGVMNLGWVALLTVVVSLEKLAPHPYRIRQVIAIAATIAAGWIVLAA